MEDLQYKLPKEWLDLILANGTIIGHHYAYIPYWYEIIDFEKGIVKMHHVENGLPKELENYERGLALRKFREYCEADPALNGLRKKLADCINEIEHIGSVSSPKDNPNIEFIQDMYNFRMDTIRSYFGIKEMKSGTIANNP